MLFLYSMHENLSELLFLIFFFSSVICLRVDADEEIIVKAMTDYWVVGKKSDQRELYVILNQKNANLIEVNGMSLCVNMFSVFESLDKI